jgi:hypothetical protein
MGKRPSPNEYSAQQSRYVDLVQEEDIVAALEKQSRTTAAMLSRLSDAEASFRYAPDKWSVKGIIGHVGDSERVFAYRALAISRGEAASLPGYDENEYARAANFDTRTLFDLVDEYVAIRKATVALFRGLSDEAWDRRGVANGNPITVRGQAYVALGHERHHLNVLREKYLSS